MCWRCMPQSLPCAGTCARRSARGLSRAARCSFAGDASSSPRCTLVLAGLSFADDALERAYSIEKNANLLYNMARIKEAKGDLEGAVELYEEFAISPGVDLEYRKESLARIKVLKEAIALKAPEEPEPEPEPEKAEPAPLTPPPKAEPASPNGLGVTLVALGGAGLLAGGIVGVVASTEHGDMSEAPTLEERRQIAERVEFLAPLADGLLIGGGVLVGAGLLSLTLMNGENDSRVTLGTSGTSATVRWSF